MFYILKNKSPWITHNQKKSLEKGVILRVSNPQKLRISPEIKVEELGCYNQGDPKALPEVLKDFEGTFKPKQASKLLNACAKLAKASGYTHFGLGENQLTCFSGPDAANTYNTGGVAGNEKCTKSGQGKAGAVYVYKLAWGEKKANPVLAVLVPCNCMGILFQL